MKTNDAVTGFVLVVFACAVFILTQGAPSIHGSEFGAALFPRIVSGIMGICGAYFIVKEGLLLARTGRGNPLFTRPDWAGSSWHVLNFLLVIGSLLAYILFSDVIGFAIVCLIILFTLFSWLRRGHLLSSFAIAVVATAVIHYGFGHFLRVPLPWGILENYAFF